MDSKKKNIVVTLELDPELAGFHTRMAENEDVTLEARLVNVIKSATETEQEKRREKAEAASEQFIMTAKKLGITAPPFFEEDYDDDFLEELLKKTENER
jgi:DNA-binding transcriptional regulator YhcF (GntR family)